MRHCGVRRPYESAAEQSARSSVITSSSLVTIVFKRATRPHHDGVCADQLKENQFYFLVVYDSISHHSKLELTSISLPENKHSNAGIKQKTRLQLSSHYSRLLSPQDKGQVISGVYLFAEVRGRIWKTHCKIHSFHKLNRNDNECTRVHVLMKKCPRSPC